MATRHVRPKNTTLLLLVLALSILAWPASAKVMRVENKHASIGTSVDTGNGDGSTDFVNRTSADGRYVVFNSTSWNLLDGVVDQNNTYDVFLHDRVAQTTILVSRSATSASMAANGASAVRGMSPDGEWILIASEATNLAPGVTDANGRQQDVFLYQRSTGELSLVSHSAASATTTASIGSFPHNISGDGEWVVFESMATDLVDGVSDNNELHDVFLYRRSTDQVRLVSRSAMSASTTSNGSSRGSTISANGQWVLFGSGASNLTPVTDNNADQDVFMYEVSTGTVRLISAAAGAQTGGNGFSYGASISSDGEWAVFISRASNLVSGVDDSNSADDVFLYQRSTGGVRLISRSAGSAAIAANNASLNAAMSVDTDWILFTSLATNLAPGVVDDNAAEDVFLYHRSTGAVTLVSAKAGSSLIAANGRSIGYSMNANADVLLLRSNATDLVTGVTDNNAVEDIYAYRRSTGAMTLLTAAVDSANTTANGVSSPSSISSNGDWVTFSSEATNLLPGITDGEGTNDFFLYQLSSQSLSLLTHSAASGAAAANNLSRSTSMSPDGEWVVFYSEATNLVPNIADNNDKRDVFLYQRGTGAVSLVSSAMGSNATTGNDFSEPGGISADGEWVLYGSNASNVLPGVVDTNLSQDVFLYRRSTGAISLVSTTADNRMSTGSWYSVATAISADGEWILFYSAATNLAPGVTDANGNREDVFLHQRSTGATTLVSAAANSATITANNSSRGTAISAGGEWILFGSNATNLIPGVADNNGSSDVFLYQRSTAQVSLVSRSDNSATTTASWQSFPTAITPDGAWVLFYSRASNVVPGVTDDNSKFDVFLHERSTGVTTLVSASATPGITANDESFPAAISNDGEWVLFRSKATDLAPGSNDDNGTNDVFLFRRSTGAVTLVSTAAGTAMMTASNESLPIAISADGAQVLFRSKATNLVAMIADDNGTDDVFLYQRDSGVMSLVSASTGSAMEVANGQSIPVALSADGEWVLYNSSAPDLDGCVLDGNAGSDLFLARVIDTNAVDPGRIFADGFDPIGSGVGPPNCVR